MQMTAQGMKRTGAVLRSFSVFTLTLIAGCRSKPISTLPDFTLLDVRGGQFHLRSQPAQPVLLAFLQTVPDTSDTPSRSQVVFLASMDQQYGPRGLRVVAVDASVLALGSTPSHAARAFGDGSSTAIWSLDAVRNASYDWQLAFPMLIDPDGRLAHKLGVDQVPTTFLISAQGQILHQWRGFTRPAVLAESIEKLLGGPLAKTP